MAPVAVFLEFFRFSSCGQQFGLTFLWAGRWSTSLSINWWIRRDFGRVHQWLKGKLYYWSWVTIYWPKRLSGGLRTLSSRGSGIFIFEIRINRISKRKYLKKPRLRHKYLPVKRIIIWISGRYQRECVSATSPPEISELFENHRKIQILKKKVLEGWDFCRH